MSIHINLIVTNFFAPSEHISLSRTSILYNGRTKIGCFSDHQVTWQISFLQHDVTCDTNMHKQENQIPSKDRPGDQHHSMSLPFVFLRNERLIYQEAWELGCHKSKWKASPTPHCKAETARPGWRREWAQWRHECFHRSLGIRWMAPLVRRRCCLSLFLPVPLRPPIPYLLLLLLSPRSHWVWGKCKSLFNYSKNAIHVVSLSMFLSFAYSTPSRDGHSLRPPWPQETRYLPWRLGVDYCETCLATILSTPM